MLIDPARTIEPQPAIYARYQEIYHRYHRQVDNYKHQWL
jgi:sugar (pentulose or hexulose) kinase